MKTTLDEYIEAVEGFDDLEGSIPIKLHGNSDWVCELGGGDNWILQVSGDYDKIMEDLVQTGKFKRDREYDRYIAEITKGSESEHWDHLYIYTPHPNLEKLGTDNSRLPPGFDFRFFVGSYREHPEAKKDIVLTLCKYVRDNNIPSRFSLQSTEPYTHPESKKFSRFLHLFEDPQGDLK